MSAPVIVAVSAALFLAVAGGLLTSIGDWYRNLRKPRWNPPDWAFGPAWTIILGLWAWSGVLAWDNTATVSDRWVVGGLYAFNAVCHLLWSPLFFRLRRPDWAAVEVVFLWSSLLALLVFVRPYSPLATWMIVPYFIWVSFAACLNIAIVRLNRPFA